MTFARGGGAFLSQRKKKILFFLSVGACLEATSPQSGSGETGLTIAQASSTYLNHTKN
jgi:hypothetical protein